METIRLSQQARDQLIRLKRWTGNKNWNVLCRWALCVSLREKNTPPMARIPADSTVEMTWKVFAGQQQDLYVALLKARCQRDGLGTTEEVLNAQVRLHIHRGIAYLAGDKRLRSIGALIRMAVEPSHELVDELVAAEP